MQNSDGVAGHVTCLLAHDLVNKLSAIVGHCDILDTTGASSACHDGSHQIRVLATLMATMLHQRQCEIDDGNRVLPRPHDKFAIEAHRRHPDKKAADAHTPVLVLL